MKKILDKIKNNKKIIIYLLMLIVFILMFILNYNTPLIADDYSYSLNLDGTKLENIFQIIQFQYHDYMSWGGRCINHFIGQIFLMLGKNIFNILNSIAYVTLTYLIYKHCIIGTKKESISLYILINVLLWIFTPWFGQSFLWLIGSANYLWSAIIVLGFILLYRKQAVKEYNIKDNIWKIIGIAIFGIIAGWTNENTGIAEISIIIMLLIYQKLVNNKKITTWQKVGLISCIIGYMILIIAPGNYIRKEEYIYKSLIQRIITITAGIITLFMPLVLIYLSNAIALNYDMKKNKKTDKEINIIFSISIIYFIGMLISAYSMICSPIVPFRIYTITNILMIIALGNLYINLDFDKNIIKFVCYSFITLLSVIYVFSYIDAYQEIKRVKNEYD